MSDRSLEFFLKTILTPSIASINFYDCKVKRRLLLADAKPSFGSPLQR
jgi:hypothetical protein